MPSESYLIACTWKEIAKYFPGFSEHQVRQRFGKEMKALSVVHKGGMPGRKRPEPAIWGVVWRIEKYYTLKAERGELGMHNAIRTRKSRKKRLDIRKVIV
jgi:hypothetical protein